MDCKVGNCGWSIRNCLKVIEQILGATHEDEMHEGVTHGGHVSDVTLYTGITDAFAAPK